MQIIVSVFHWTVAQTCVWLCQLDNALCAHGKLAADAMVALWADADFLCDELKAPFIFDRAVVRGLVDTHPLPAFILPEKVVSLRLRAKCATVGAPFLRISFGDAANFQLRLLHLS